MVDKLTIALSYYNSPLMLTVQIKNWQNYPDALSSHIKVILVDDGSMLLSAEKELKKANLKINVELYRITKDIPQNIFGVRNLALHIASVEAMEWVLITDLDHVLPARAIDGFLNLKPNLSPLFFYTPARYKKEKEAIVPIGRHLDSFLITPELYWKTGGYDEDLTGYYYNGASLVFRRMLNKISKGVEIDKVYTIFYPSSVVADASPMQGQEKKIFEGDYPADKKPSVLNFEWERVL